MVLGAQTSLFHQFSSKKGPKGQRLGVHLGCSGQTAPQVHRGSAKEGFFTDFREIEEGKLEDVLGRLLVSKKHKKNNQK